MARPDAREIDRGKEALHPEASFEARPARAEKCRQFCDNSEAPVVFVGKPLMFAVFLPLRFRSAILSEP